MSLSRSASRFQNILEKVDYRLATTNDEKREIYQLRYRAYLKEGAILPNSQEMTSDRYDELPNSWIFGVYIDGDLASSLRISIGSKEHPETPSMDVFPDLLAPEIAAGKIFVDPTRFVADPDRAQRFPALPYLTVRLAYVACAHFEADLGLATVRTEHQAFYRRVFMHRPLSPAREYPGLIKPISLMAVDFAKQRNEVFARYPFMQSSESERTRLFDRTDPGFEAVDMSRATIAPR